MRTAANDRIGQFCRCLSGPVLKARHDSRDPDRQCRTEITRRSPVSVGKSIRLYLADGTPGGLLHCGRTRTVAMIGRSEAPVSVSAPGKLKVLIKLSGRDRCERGAAVCRRHP